MLKPFRFISEEKLSIAVVLRVPRWPLYLRWACLHLSCIIFFLELLPCAVQALLFLQPQDEPDQWVCLELSEGKKNAGEFFSWIIFHIWSKLFCVLCQNQVYWNTLQIRAFGQEECLTSCQASDTLSDHHWKGIRNTFRDHQF